jgi:glycosyltransferase involved in cell wall biosynthesis
MNFTLYDALYPALIHDITHEPTLDGVPLYHMGRHIPHHCTHSGYDALAKYLGHPLFPSFLEHAVGETVLRPATDLAARMSGIRNYTRTSALREFLATRHMARTSNSLYHMMYADSDMRYVSPRGQGNRLVATFHIPLHRKPSHRHLTHFQDRLAHALVISQSQVEEMEALFGKGRVTAVPYGVDCRFFLPAKRTPPLPLRLVFVGVHARDFQTLGILARRLAGHKDFELTLITDRRGRDFATASNIRWKQGLSAEAYVHELQRAHALLLPLLMSTANTAILEGLACGLPALTNPGGVSEYVNDACAKLWPRGDADAAMDMLMQLKESPDTVQRMSQAAREQALRHDWRALVPIYKAAFKKALS